MMVNMQTETIIEVTKEARKSETERDRKGTRKKRQNGEEY